MNKNSKTSTRKLVLCAILTATVVILQLIGAVIRFGPFSISLVLGVVATDAKSAQSLVMPINFAAMIPYFLSIMVDIKTLSPVVKYVVYAIPFTHTFMASENVMFSNMSLYWGGFAYQVVFLAVCLFIAMRIFMSDRVFTMSLGGKNNKRKKSLRKAETV